MTRDLAFATPHGRLAGEVSLPPEPRGLVVVAGLHSSPLTGPIAEAAAEARLAVFTLELLTAQELHFPDSAHNVPLLCERLLHGLELAQRDAETQDLPVGIFADAAAAPAAIRAAARRDSQVRALACHGGLVDVAGIQNLELLAAALLMLADADDTVSEASLRRAAAHLSAPWECVTLAPGESPARRAVAWLAGRLAGPGAA